MKWLALLALLSSCGNDHRRADPGRVTLHRLNNAEYNNTVRDLLGTSLRPAIDFPADERAYGFDNVADAQTLSPLQLEMYERAADALIGDGKPVRVTAARVRCDARSLR